jgi:hypothetical protein
MPGQIVGPNDVMIRAGVGLRITTSTPLPSFIRGRFGYVGAANWGPLNTATEMLSRHQIQDTFGESGAPGNTMDGAEEIFNGGAVTGVIVRVGTGGTQGSDTLTDSAVGTPVTVGSIKVLYPGARAFAYTIRNSLSDTNSKELVVYEGTLQREVWMFPKKAGVASNEIDSLVSAVNNHSLYVTITKQANGDGTVKTVAQKAIPPGTAPTIDDAAYSTALTELGKENFFVTCVDSELETQQTIVRAWIDDQQMHGRRRVAVLGIPITETWTERKRRSVVANNPAVVIVGNGFERHGADGLEVITCDGYLAAARLAGGYTASKPNQQLTHRVIPDATGLVGPLTDDQLTEAKLSGLSTFSMSFRGRIWISEGVNTLIDAALPPVWAESMSSAWNKMRRVMTRFYLIDDITAQWDDMIGTVNNTDTGRAVLKTAAQAIVNSYIANGALISGTVAVDASRQPNAAADEAFFIFNNLVDADGAERLILNAMFP